MRNALVAGGTSGLGLEIARCYAGEYAVTVMGRHDPHEDGVRFVPIDLCSPSDCSDVFSALVGTQRTDLLVYAAGFFQEGAIDEVSDSAIAAMTHLGIAAPAMLLQRILAAQHSLPGLIAITSTSQWTPRKLEPVYTAAKAGLGMLAQSISLDERVGQVLVAAPAGMKTRFWRDSDRDTSSMLDPAWVARQVVMHFAKGAYRFRSIDILRGPPCTVIRETH